MERSRHRRYGRLLLNGLCSQNNQNQNCYFFSIPRFVSQSLSKHLQHTKTTKGHNNLLCSGYLVEIPSFRNTSLSNSMCEKPISKRLIRNTQYFDRNPRFLNKILGILIEILGFSFEVLGSRKYATIVFHKSLGITKRQLVLFLLFVCAIGQEYLSNILGQVYNIREAVTRWCSVKNMFFKISQNSQGNISARVSSLIACNFIKEEALAQEFPQEFCEICKNTFFTEHL